MGRVLSLKLARCGAHVYTFNLVENIDNNCEVEKIDDGEITHLNCDIRESEQIRTNVENIFSAEGKIDILINNAGIWLEGDLSQTEASKIRNVIETNLTGTIMVTQTVLPLLEPSLTPIILIINSTAGIEPGPEWAVYSASKFGLRGFTDSLKLSLKGKGVRVIGFYPGGMDTDLYENSGISKYSKAESWMMNKEEIADVIVFILNQPVDILIDHIEVRKFNK